MAQVIEIDFAKEVDNMGDGEQTEQDKTQVFGTWAKAATGDFLSEVQAADASMYSNMIVGSGDADYTNILNSLPSGRQSSIMGSSSVYFRNENIKHVCSDSQWKTKTTCLAEGTCSDATYNNNQTDCEANSGTFTSAGNTWESFAPLFLIYEGTIFKFENELQFNVAYHQIIKGTAIKQMEHHQSLSPNSARASLISSRTSERAADVAVFAADANATYTAEDLSDPAPASLLKYQPRKKRYQSS